MRKLNVLYLSDNNYAPYLGVSILSLLKNNTDFDIINIFVIDDNISDDNKSKLSSYSDDYKNLNLTFLNMSHGVNTLQEMGVPKYRNSYTTYLKLFAFSMLPDEIDRIVFIDTDSVVVGSLAELMVYDMKNNVLAAVKEAIAHDEMIELGYPEDDVWFNMGMILVDIKKWKEENAYEKVIAQLKKRQRYFSVDQDILNIICHGRIGTLHPKYNNMPHFVVYKGKDYLKAFPQENYYPIDIIDECKKEGVILHFERFIGESAWNVPTVHPYAATFREYLAQTPWKGLELKPAKVSMIFRIEKMLYVILPKSIFVRIYGVAYRCFIKNTNKKMKKESFNNVG